MWSTVIVKVEIAANRSTRLADAVVSPQIDLFVFDAAPQPLDEHVIPQAPLPSMLIAMALSASTPVNAAPVNANPGLC